MQPPQTPTSPQIAIAGATGHLGGRIAYHLLRRRAGVRALVRSQSSVEAIRLRDAGAQVVEVDFNNVASLAEACTGAQCVLSAMAGLRDVIVDGQTRLLEAAVSAGVPRFIPSDFSVDYRPLKEGTNRNLNLRHEFNLRLDAAPIKATSVLNGMFADLLTGQAPVVLFGMKRVLYWGSADQPMDFTTIENTAEYTAAAALDNDTPRYLNIAGEVATMRDIRRAASEVTGEKFRFLRPGGIRLFSSIIRLTHALTPKSDDVVPAWQGMQYMRDMLSGKSKLQSLDNSRYPGIRWTSIREVLARR